MPILENSLWSVFLLIRIIKVIQTKILEETLKVNEAYCISFRVCESKEILNFKNYLMYYRLSG